MHPINHPEVMLSNAQQHIDENGKVINEKTCALIRQLIEELVRWTKRLKQKT
jgi:chromate reductase